MEMKRKEREKIEQYKEEVTERRTRTLMDALVPDTMVNVRMKFGLPKSQRQYSDGTSLVEENAMLKISVLFQPISRILVRSSCGFMEI